MADQALRILIVSFNFPPLPRVGSLRPLSWARRWSELGHDVTVLTARHPVEGAEPQFLVDLKSRGRIHIEEVPYRSLRKTGGAHTGGGQRPAAQGARRGMSALRRLPRRAAGTVLRYAGINIDSPHLWMLPALRRADAICRAASFDVVVSSYSPPASHIVAASIKRKYGPYWVADYRDLWSENHFFRGKWPFSAIERRIETRVVARADLLSTVSEPWRHRLARFLGIDAVTIPNGYDTEIEAVDNGRFLPRDGRKRVVYTGTVYLSRQDPGALFRALNQLRDEDPHLPEKIEVVFLGNAIGDLAGAAAAAGVGDMVSLVSFSDGASALRAQRDADLLLYLDWADRRIEGVIGAKIYEYFRSGTPILCLGTDTRSEAAKLVRETATGYVTGNSQEAVAARLRTLLAGGPPDFHPRAEIIARYDRAVLAETMLEEIVARRVRLQAR